MEFKNKLPIRWVDQKENIGPDRNFDAVVEFSKGQYCWLLGDDDVVKPGALSKLIDDIEEYQADIIQFGYTQGDFHLKPVADFNPPHCVVSSREILIDYFSRQKNMSLLFTFISAYCFKKSIWMSNRNLILGWAGTFYIQMFAMHLALANGSSLVGISDSYVVARANYVDGPYKIPGRFMLLDATTVSKLIAEVYADRLDVWRAFGCPFRRSYPHKALIYAAAYGGLSYINEAHKNLVKLGVSSTLLNFLYFARKMRLLKFIKFLIILRRELFIRVNKLLED
jgi:glycosyltransferase involved in cell wall biosynthesis